MKDTLTDFETASVSIAASLAAAISLLERTPKAKKAAPSDKMFDLMLQDYQKALETWRATYSKHPRSGRNLPIKTVSKPRRRFLEFLVKSGGTVKAAQMTVPERGLATRMQADGLVKWGMPDVQSRHTCIGQTVTITEAGRCAI